MAGAGEENFVEIWRKVVVRVAGVRAGVLVADRRGYDEDGFGLCGARWEGTRWGGAGIRCGREWARPTIGGFRSSLARPTLLACCEAQTSRSRGRILMAAYVDMLEFEQVGQPVLRLAGVDTLCIYTERTVEIGITPAGRWKEAFVHDVATVPPPMADRFPNDPKSIYALYQLRSARELTILCQSVSATYAVATIVSPAPIPPERIASLALAWADRDPLARMLEGFVRSQLPWLYFVGFFYPLARTVFAAHDPEDVRRVVRAGIRCGDFHINECNVELADEAR